MLHPKRDLFLCNAHSDLGNSAYDQMDPSLVLEKDAVNDKDEWETSNEIFAWDELPPSECIIAGDTNTSGSFYS